MARQCKRHGTTDAIAARIVLERLGEKLKYCRARTIPSTMSFDPIAPEEGMSASRIAGRTSNYQRDPVALIRSDGRAQLALFRVLATVVAVHVFDRGGTPTL